MKRYEDYQVDKEKPCLNQEEIKNVEWTKYKIVVPTESDKEEILLGFKHFHDSLDIDTDYIVVNQMAHEYITANNIIVDEELYNKLDR
jgi:hypothetical protein